MTVKLFEVRDRATCVPMLAVHLRNRTPEEYFLLRRAGYSAEQIGGREEDVEPYIVLMKLDGVRANYDPYAWGDRTFTAAHRHIIEHWADLASGAVVDVRFILGETAAPCQSEAVAR